MNLPKLTQQNKMLLLSFSLLLLCYFLFSPGKNEKQKSLQKVYADTMIPAGFVLVPIQLGNADAVSALMDQYGVVDLYAGSELGKGARRIATKVKILKAPLNPREYAVLVPEDLSNLIMSSQGPFWAIVQNRETPQDLNTIKKAKSVRIEYQQAGG